LRKIRRNVRAPRRDRRASRAKDASTLTVRDTVFMPRLDRQRPIRVSTPITSTPSLPPMFPAVPGLRHAAAAAPAPQSGADSRGMPRFCGLARRGVDRRRKVLESMATVTAAPKSLRLLWRRATLSRLQIAPRRSIRRRRPMAKGASSWIPIRRVRGEDRRPAGRETPVPLRDLAPGCISSQ